MQLRSVDAYMKMNGTCFCDTLPCTDDDESPLMRAANDDEDAESVASFMYEGLDN